MTVRRRTRVIREIFGRKLGLTPLVANPRATSASRKRVVRRAYDGTSSGNCSAKMVREQAALGQKNLRTVSSNVTCRPAQGRSATRRVWRLWMRHACTPHKGQQAVGDDEITEISSSWVEGVTCSIWSPSDKGRNGDLSIFLHLVLLKSVSLENNRERDFHPQTASRHT